MEYLRKGTFGELFAVTFTIAATFQILLALLGLFAAILSPHIFSLNGTRAAGPLQAIGVDLFLLVVLLLLNAMMSAAGAGMWVLSRPIRPKSSQP